MPDDNPAQSYESYMVPALFAPCAERLVSAAGLGPGEQVLDLGCGTGAVARRVAKTADAATRVTGVDLSPHMLAVARDAAQRERLAISWQEGRAEQLPFADGSFSLVLCQFAAMFFADRHAALREARRVLGRGGRIALAVFAPIARHPFYARLDQVMRERAGVSALQAIFALGDAPELERMLEAAGFAGVRSEALAFTARFPDPDAFLAGEIAVDTAAIPELQKLDAAARRKLTDAISADMRAPLRELVQDEHVVMPFHLLHAFARA
jgi:ubiquinone/menaquinone biosynthesis C-methylase UbiE